MEQNPTCKKHNLPKAPLGPAILIPKIDNKRIEELELTYKEMADMSKGFMAIRHFTYDTWCEDRFISWL